MTADVHLLPKDTKSSVAAVCRALGLPRSRVYERRSRQPSRRAQDTALLDVEVTYVLAVAGTARTYGFFREGGLVVTADVHLLPKDTKSSVAAVCRALGLPRSRVYERRSRQPSRRAQDTALLDVEVTALHKESKQRYGSPRIHRALRRQGRNVGRKRVEGRMRALGLRSKRVEVFRRTKPANDAHAASPNLLNRQFARATPHELGAATSRSSYEAQN